MTARRRERRSARARVARVQAPWLCVRAPAIAALLVAAIAAAAANPERTGDTDDPLPATRALAQRLRASGRAEAAIERTVYDPIDAKRRSVRGRLALEPPDRASLDFPATGERVTLRTDGGEWIQPQLSQLLVLGPERAASALRWWELLVRERDERFVARRVGPRSFVMIAREGGGAPADSAWVTLDRSGLPVRLEIDEGGEGRTLYRFSGWRFTRPRGRAAFVLRPPAGFEVIRMR